MSNQSGYKDHWRTKQPEDEGLDETICSGGMVSTYDTTETLWIEHHKGREMEWGGQFYPPNA
jgi:hypothetical protein